MASLCRPLCNLSWELCHILALKIVLTFLHCRLFQWGSTMLIHWLILECCLNRTGWNSNSGQRDLKKVRQEAITEVVMGKTDLIIIWITMISKPESQELLVNVLRFLSSFMPFLVSLAYPIPVTIVKFLQRRDGKHAQGLKEQNQQRHLHVSDMISRVLRPLRLLLYMYLSRLYTCLLA